MYLSHAQAGPYDSLKDVALKILQNKVSTVPIIHSSSPDGSFPQLLHLASLSGILKCKFPTPNFPHHNSLLHLSLILLTAEHRPIFPGICRHFKHSSSSLPILQQPICSVPLGTWVPKIGESSRLPFATLKPNASLGDALSMLVEGDCGL